MTDEMIVLAKRAVACKGWRWMSGMLGWRPNNQGVPHSIRFVEGVESMGALASVGTGPLVASGYATCDGDWRSADITPDLSDPATLGCLLALVREAWKDPALCVVFDTSDGRWHVGRWEDGMSMRGRGGATEAEALVDALESAPHTH